MQVDAHASRRGKATKRGPYPNAEEEKQYYDDIKTYTYKTGDLSACPKDFCLGCTGNDRVPQTIDCTPVCQYVQHHTRDDPEDSRIWYKCAPRNHASPAPPRPDKIVRMDDNEDAPLYQKIFHSLGMR
ncbi:unnamed protein product [Amoebophrya sp. A120]|nr:unnamed protein product [Amoebophrya sp. A120]|eukprot:GSA120T00009152001.1